MGIYKEVEGNLIHFALNEKFDVIAHGCNCFCTMGAGIAPQMVKAFACDKFPLEDIKYRGDINKLGQIDFKRVMQFENSPVFSPDVNSIVIGEYTTELPSSIIVVNAYTQYRYGSNHADGVKKPFDSDAFTLCMRKINHTFKGKHIGLPRIGAGLAGGNWDEIKEIIKTELKDCDVTIVTLPK